MKAYKFRSHDQLEFAFDILFGNRLYCASRETLNDPVEGAYGAMILDSVDKAKAAEKEVAEVAKALKICSLSQTSNEQLLWAYYASGFTGMAVEVEIPDPTTYSPSIDEGSIRIKAVDYDRRALLGTLPYDDPQSAAYESLVTKGRHWEHEKEVRIIANTPALDKGCYYQLAAPPTALHVGCRMPKASMFALATVCEKIKIPFAVVSPIPAEIPSMEIAFHKTMIYPGGSIKLPDRSNY